MVMDTMLVSYKHFIHVNCIHHLILILAISIQVQKVLQTLEDSEEQQQPLTHCKMEPNMGGSPKLETIEVIVIILLHSFMT